MISVNQLHPLFFGEIVGADLTAEPTEALRTAVQDAMDKHGVCVVRQRPITDEQHIRFARLFAFVSPPAARFVLRVLAAQYAQTSISTGWSSAHRRRDDARAVARRRRRATGGWLD